MQEKNTGPQQLRVVVQFRQQKTFFCLRLPLLLIVMALVVPTLACGFARNGGQPAVERGFILTRLPTLTRTPLPTLTPTAVATAVAMAPNGEPPAPGPPLSAEVDAAATPIVVEAAEAAPILIPASTVAEFVPPAEPAAATQPPPSPTDTPTSMPTATATATPIPTNTPTATPTPVVETPDWIFDNVLIYPDQYEDGLLLYGEMLNNTGVAQQLDYISGTFYDSQGQIIADENSTGDYWPFKLIPAGERLPFGLFVDGIYDAANFDLQVQAEPGSETQRLDFQFLNLKQWLDDIGEYCVAGELQNPGGKLQEYVLVMATLYDSQEKVINFGDELEPRPAILGDETLDFEICTQTLGQPVARYDLRAWGQ